MAAPAQQLKQLFLSQSTRKERGCSLSLPHPPHSCCKSLQKQQPSYRCLGIVLPFPEPELQSKSECLCWVRDELRGATAETLLWLIPNPPSHHSGTQVVAACIPLDGKSFFLWIPALNVYLKSVAAPQSPSQSQPSRSSRA